MLDMLSTFFGMQAPSFRKLMSAHFHAWKLGLKTSQYYLRTQAAAKAVQVTVDPSLTSKKAGRRQEAPIDEGCTMCSA